MGSDKPDIGHVRMSYFRVKRMSTETSQNSVKKPRGWEVLEEKLKAKGLSAGEIAQARKSFYDGIETLTKMFLSTHSVNQLKEKETQEGFE